MSKAFPKIVLPLTVLTLFLASSCLPWGWGGPGYSSGQGGMMGGGGMGGGMMGGGSGMMGGQRGPAYTYGAPVQAITIDRAVNLAQEYAASLGNPDIVVDEVEEYNNNFYVLYKEKSTGIHAFEMLVDKYSGGISPEPGPNMMWNNKYGMMTSMMGTRAATAPSVSPQQAKAQAKAFLDANLPGVSPGDVHIFYGYYTIMVKKGDQNYGMLSVNGYSGQVWYHTWHGDFVQEKEVNS